jgi:hypothetical protein
VPTPRVAMRKIKECLRLKLECGLSNELVARAMGLSKGVVSKYVSGARAGSGLAGIVGAGRGADRGALCLPVPVVRGERVPIDLPFVHRELRRKGVTLQLLWQEYLEATPGSRPTGTRSSASTTTTMRPRCGARCARCIGPARSCSSTTPAQTVPIVDPDTGEMRAAHIFVAVLGASNYTYACATGARPRRTGCAD